MTEPSAPRRRLLLLAFLAAFLFFLLGTGSSSLFDVDEPRFAEASRDMIVRGDGMLPMLAGEPRLDKPILVYWLQMLGYALFGVGETGARFPSALGLAIAIATTIRIGARVFGAKGGFAAGLVLATSVQAGITGRAATADGLLLGCVVVTIDALHARVHGRRSFGTWLTLWLGVAACGLAKGPPGWVAPGVAGIGAILTVPRGERWRRLLPAGPGLILAVGLVLAWAIPVDLRTDGGIFRVALGHHVLDRAGGGVAGLGGWAPWWFLFYIPAVLLAFFPWSAWLPAAFSAWRSFDIGGKDRAFLGWWIGGTLLLFTVVIGKRLHYVLPMFPALAVLVGGALSGPRWRPGRFGRGLLVAVSVSGAVGIPWFLAAKSIPGTLRPGLMIGVVLFLYAAGVYGWRRDRAATRTVAATAIAVAAVFGILLVALLPALDRHRLVPRVGAALAKAAPPGTRRIVMDFDPDGLFFYSQRDAGGSLTTERTVPWERLALGKPLLARLRSGEPVAVVLTQARRDRILKSQSLDRLPARLVGECTGYDAKRNEWLTVLIYAAP